MNVKIKTVLFEITDKCNLHCSHCMNRPDCKGIETNVDAIKDLFDKFSKYNAEKVYLSGGEPLVHHSIHNIIELCKLYPSMKFIITTNGLLLSDELMRLIDSIENVTLQFSVDGVSVESFEALRGEHTFKKFTEKMKLWDTMSTKQGLARTCLNRYNYKELPLIYKYCLEHRLYPSFIFLSSLGNGKNNWDKLELNLAQKIWCINAINKLNSHFNINITPPEAPATCNFTEKTGIGSLLIRADGRVAPCQYFYDESLGNIFEDDIPDIFNNPWIKKHCEIAEKRKELLENSAKCKSCKIKKGCNFGCIGIANDLGNIMSYDGLCELRVMTTICYSNKIIKMSQISQKTNIVGVVSDEEDGV